MGTTQHHALIVTSWDERGVKAAHEIATGIFEWVSPISPGTTNGYSSFFVPPDGSKEWWPESDEGDKRREKFIAAIKENYGKRWYVKVAEVSFGELGWTVSNPITKEEES